MRHMLTIAKLIIRIQWSVLDTSYFVFTHCEFANGALFIKWFEYHSPTGYQQGTCNRRMLQLTRTIQWLPSGEPGLQRCYICHRLSKVAGTTQAIHWCYIWHRLSKSFPTGHWTFIGVTTDMDRPTVDQRDTGHSSVVQLAWTIQRCSNGTVEISLSEIFPKKQRHV